MKANCWILIKVLVKSSLDNYVLPGTLTGTEILLVYMKQWKRHISFVTIGTMHLISSQLELSRRHSILSQGQHNTLED